MTQPRMIAINGKFLSAAPTGVHRVAGELANALAALRDEGHPAVAGLAFELLLPRDGVDRARGIALPSRVLAPLVSIPWEQITLPLRRGNRLLLNLCNIGPALTREAVTMIHDAQVHLSPGSYGWPFRLWYRFIQPLFARRHRHILTVSHYSRDMIAGAGLCTADRISVIHNGVDHILREPADERVIARLALARHGYVLALSTAQAHKNIEVLLRAFADPRIAGTELILIGGDCREAFAERGVPWPANARATGRVSDAELRALMEQALCLAFPSTTEGFGLPPMEAMLLGCPAIVAPCGALPEICGDAALQVTPHDPAAWAEAIMRLRDDPVARTNFAAAGQARAQRYSWRAAAISLAKVLHRINVPLRNS